MLSFKSVLYIVVFINKVIMYFLRLENFVKKIYIFYYNLYYKREKIIYIILKFLDWFLELFVISWFGIIYFT